MRSPLARLAEPTKVPVDLCTCYAEWDWSWRGNIWAVKASQRRWFPLMEEVVRAVRGESARAVLEQLVPLAMDRIDANLNGELEAANED